MQANAHMLALLAQDNGFPASHAFRAIAMDYADPQLIQVVINLNAMFAL